MNEKRRFPKLSSETYEHPSDKKALNDVREIKGMETIARKAIEYEIERITSQNREVIHHMCMRKGGFILK